VIDTDGSAWDEAYPSAERIALVGLSTVPATLVDLFNAITSRCDVEAHFFLRRGTGPFLNNGSETCGRYRIRGRWWLRD